jgi:hypothetical protein
MKLQPQRKGGHVNKVGGLVLTSRCQGFLFSVFRDRVQQEIQSLSQAMHGFWDCLIDQQNRARPFT